MEIPDKKTRIFFALGAAAVLFGLFVLYNSHENGTLVPGGEPSATTTSGVQEVVIDVTPAEIPIYAGRPVAELSADPALVAQVPIEKLSEQKKQLEELAAKVAETSTDVDSWLAAAGIKKFWNDFAGARDIWEYLTRLAPEHPIAFYNLGNLAKLVDRDFASAESLYRAALKKDPTFVLASFDLAELYWEFVPSRKNEAFPVLEASLKVVPNEVTTLVTLSRYHKELGDLEKALLYAEKALALYPEDENLNRAVSEIKALQ